MENKIYYKKGRSLYLYFFLYIQINKSFQLLIRHFWELYNVAMHLKTLQCIFKRNIINKRMFKYM